MMQPFESTSEIFDQRLKIVSEVEGTWIHTTGSVNQFYSIHDDPKLFLEMTCLGCQRGLQSDPCSPFLCWNCPFGASMQGFEAEKFKNFRLNR